MQCTSTLLRATPGSLSNSLHAAPCMQNPRLPSIFFPLRPPALRLLLLLPLSSRLKITPFPPALAYAVGRGRSIAVLISPLSVARSSWALAPLRHTWFGTVVLPRCLGPVIPPRNPLVLRKRLALCMPWPPTTSLGLPWVAPASTATAEPGGV